MKTTLIRALFCLVFWPVHPTVAAEAVAGPIPVETFFAEADARAMQVSPNGRYLAFLTTLGYGKVGIALQDLTVAKPPEAFVSAQDENIKDFFWKGDDYIVYGGDIGGDESPAWRSIPVAPPKPGEKRRVTALSEAYRERYAEDANFVRIVDELKFDPLHVLVFGRREPGSNLVGMYLMDVRDGRRTPVESYAPPRADNDFQAFYDTENVADNNGILRARSRLAGKVMIFEVRPTPDSEYVKVAEFPAGQPAWQFLFFARDNETLYLLSTEHTDTGTLHTLNVRTHKLSPPLFHSPDGEVERVLTSWDRSKLYGVSCLTDKRHYEFFDPGRERLQKELDLSLPGTKNDVVSSSQDEKTLIVLAASDRDPGTYYVLKNGRLGGIARVRSRIDPALMRPMDPISFRARDGLTIHGYLTRPAAAARGRVPLVLHPHGGPYGIRDDWGFDPEVQLYASRGYAVLQVNYRGSGGYGTSFERAGYHEWGAKMQDDLTDAVKWAIDQGIADPKRVAIVGASYGGYATLAGLVFTPDLYCCGVNYVGPGDLNMLVGMGRSENVERTELFYRQQVGTDREILHARSPVNFIDRLRVPLLNAYGYNDPRVDFEQWKRLKSKLDEYKKNYEIIVEGNEGHGFHNEDNRIAYYRRVDAFLGKWLSPNP